MPSKEQITQKIAGLEDSFASTWKDREYGEDEVWKGEENGARFEVNKHHDDDIFLILRGRSLKGRKQVLADFVTVLGEPTVPGVGLPKQHLFTWSKDERLIKLKELLKQTSEVTSPEE